MITLPILIDHIKVILSPFGLTLAISGLHYYLGRHKSCPNFASPKQNSGVV